jgi:hypothetical protein
MARLRARKVAVQSNPNDMRVQLYLPETGLQAVHSVETRGVLELTALIAATTLRTCICNAIVMCSYDGTSHNEVESIKYGFWSGT